MNVKVFLWFVVARGRRVRHGAQLRDPGRAKHPAYAGTVRPLPAQLTGMTIKLIFFKRQKIFISLIIRKLPLKNLRPIGHRL